jgi:hypothetical protein
MHAVAFHRVDFGARYADDPESEQEGPRMSTDENRSRDMIDFILDYWDGPIAGIATYREQPCYFERVFDEVADEYSNVYAVTAVSDTTRSLGREAAVMWRQEWRLPKGTAWDALMREFDERLAADRAQNLPFQAVATFTRVGGNDVMQDSYTVDWQTY